VDTVRRRFNAVLRTLADREHLLAKVACEAAPTITGIKPASLVTFCRHERNIYNTWNKHKTEACAVLGCQYCELKKTAAYILVLFYNPGLLDRIIAAGDNQAFLSALGYRPGMTLAQMLPLLQKKFTSSAFPHELGLLLGIPRDDVIAFIENQGAGCLFCGYWKVYNNPAWAHGMFQRYDAAKLQVMNGICALRQTPAAPASVK
jgi:hypothetical protein